jgi:hypothetical protein
MTAPFEGKLRRKYLANRAVPHMLKDVKLIEGNPAGDAGTPRSF